MNPKSQYNVRVVPSSWWPQGRSMVHDGLFYSCSIPLQSADALLALYDPTAELLEFKGPKLYYTYEPSWHNNYSKHPVGRQLKTHLDNSEWVYYANPDPKYRVEHITWGLSLTKSRTGIPAQKAVACVTNFGGQFWFLKPYIRPRNQMILQPQVDLYGRSQSWATFRHFPAVWRRGVPDNYRGQIPGNHMDDSFREFLSRYKVCVCLENTCEPYYFTEKFVNAVRAGCIPVYRAHPTVAEKFLKGAKWVDPADFGSDPKRTLAHALSADLETFRAANDAWLDSGILNSSGYQGYFSRIHELLKAKLTPEPAQPLSLDLIRALDAQKN